MGCLLAMIGAAAPRVGLFVFWLLRPERVEAAFDTFLLPLAGILLVPTATLLYAVLYSAGAGLSGGEVFWVVVAGIFDLVHLGVAVGRKRDVPPKYGTDASGRAFRST